MKRALFTTVLLTAACVLEGNPGAYKATKRNQCAFSTGAFLAGTTAEAAINEGAGFVSQKSSSWGDENGYAAIGYNLANCASNEVLSIFQATETLVVPEDGQPDWDALDRFMVDARSKGLLTNFKQLMSHARSAGFGSSLDQEIPKYEQGLQCACKLALKNTLPPAE